jgi:hypothetical protein
MYTRKERQRVSATGTMLSYAVTHPAAGADAR